jgi:hypothetical protein
MNIIQMIDATQQFLEFNFSLEIAVVGVFLIVIGLIIALCGDKLGHSILGGLLFVAGICVFLGGQVNYYEVPQTNYMIVCDEDTTVKEVMEKYHIIEQVGGALIVTDRDK